MGSIYLVWILGRSYLLVKDFFGFGWFGKNICKCLLEALAYACKYFAVIFFLNI